MGDNTYPSNPFQELKALSRMVDEKRADVRKFAVSVWDAVAQGLTDGEREAFLSLLDI
jgi:hypothetical protein